MNVFIVINSITDTFLQYCKMNAKIIIFFA